MTSQPYDELRKLEELAKAAQQKDAEAKKLAAERETPASAQRFDALEASAKRIADERFIKEQRHKAGNAIGENIEHVTRGVPGQPDRSPPMRVSLDVDYGKPDAQRSGSPARQGSMQPTPAGTTYVPARPGAPVDQPRGVPQPTNNTNETTRSADQHRKDDPWNKPRAAEMTDGKQAAMNREASKEVTDSRQKNPFDREASERAQRLVNTIATRSRDDGRGLG